ncbi:hypothetical protein Ais01nite_11020 [Asanoa ishikariensis]|uniref:Uncharacterized protein n=1 Tax=Asanoa ishikariensis TaxID=137265 RepID=A0A1H3T2V3_9ACTN|nr:hypothetical protein [Asanoa ishikariensis]GIF63067.1 hypothetical protein Ais01nite_11020 [Asanoa ishikariensis]SDZ44606.1 hypothetical protein SAMN05421684_5126 [Asanoa ishikariensis]
MSYRALFDATIPAEPPPRDTVDALIGRARRRLALQRLGATAGGVAVVVAATAGGFAVASGPAPSWAPVTVAPMTPAPTTSAAPAPRPSTLRGVDSKESTAHAVARLRSAFPRAIRDAVPGVHLGGMPTVVRRNVPATPTGTGGTYPARFFYDMPAPLTVEVAGRQGKIGFSLHRLIEDSFCEPPNEDPGGPPRATATHESSCVETKGPGGQRVVMATLVGPEPGRVVIDMRVDQPDGSMVNVSLDSPTGAVLTVEQLLAIALNPRVSFYP